VPVLETFVSRVHGVFRKTFQLFGGFKMRPSPKGNLASIEALLVILEACKSDSSNVMIHLDEEYLAFP